MNFSSSRRPYLRIAFCVGLLSAASASGATITWIGGNADWLDGTNTTNWNPQDEPDSDDTAFFNTANAILLGSNNAVVGLTMSNGMDVDTNGFDLTVDGLVQLADANTNLVVGLDTSFVQADSVAVNNGANLQLDGGTLQIIEETGNGLFDVNAGGELLGYGLLSLADSLGATTTLLVNDGAITARRSSGLIISPPPAGTLNIASLDSDARIDLDGSAEGGVVNVNRNQTLDLNVALADVFNGSVNMGHNTRLDVAQPWTLGAVGTINIDNGFVDGFPSIPAGTATIAGGTLSQTSGTITVVDADGTLQFDAPFQMTGGALVNNGLIVFNANSATTAGANVTMPTTSSSLRVEAGYQATITQGNFNVDGANAATNTLTVMQGAQLSVSTTDYDPDSATNAFDGTIHLNTGHFHMDSSDAEFVMDGSLISDTTGNSLGIWSGDPLDIGNDVGLLDADVTVTGTKATQFDTQVDFNSDADVDVADGASILFLGTVNFNPVNGGNNAQFTGAGDLTFNAAVNFNEATTLNMPGGVIDFDGIDVTGDSINIDAPLTVEAMFLSAFGKVNNAGTNILDINNSAGTGVLTVNLDDADGEWTLNPAGVINLVNDSTEATLLAGSDANLNGTVNVTGDVRMDARVDLAGTVNINTAGEPLRLSGGNLSPDVNTIAGGTVSGVGLLGADTGTALEGYGTINTGVAFAGTSSLRAKGGTLTLNNAAISANILGTADPTGTLNVVPAWSLAGGGVVLNGGVLQGGALTLNNGNGLQGRGTVSCRVVNNTKLLGGNGGSLIFQTAGNDNDWDGTTNTGLIHALSADVELVDNFSFDFAGIVRAENGYEVFSNGFALNFSPGSTLVLNNGGIYRSTVSTDIGGAVSIGAGAAASIQVTNNYFLTFESTSATALASNLQLSNNNIIVRTGATFSGSGALIVTPGSFIWAENNSEIDVLFDLRGTLQPGNSQGIARMDVHDYQQAATGALLAEIAGPGLNEYDRVVVDGTAQISGLLDLDIDNGYVPAAGASFIILSATNGVSGHFNGMTQGGLPPGYTFQITYEPNLVRATVVAGTQYDLWIAGFPSLVNAADRLATADPDNDGLPNGAEFAIGGDPTKNAPPKIFPKIAPVGGQNAFTMTFLSRFGAGELFFPPQRLDPEDVVTVFIEAGDTPGGTNFYAEKVYGTDATAIQAGLPAAPEGYQYVTYRTPGAVADDPKDFMRLRFEF